MFKRITFTLTAFIIGVSVNLCPMLAYASETNEPVNMESTADTDSVLTEDEDEIIGEDLEENTEDYSVMPISLEEEDYIAMIYENSIDGDEEEVYVFRDDAHFTEVKNELRKLSQDFFDNELKEDSETVDADFVSLTVQYASYNDNTAGIYEAEPMSVYPKEYEKFVKDVLSKEETMLYTDAASQYSSIVSKIDNKQKELEAEAKEQERQEEINSLPTFDLTQTMPKQVLNDYEWKPEADANGNRVYTMRLYMEAQKPVKLELFYNASDKAPTLNFLSPSNKIYIGSTQEEDTKIEIRSGLTIEGYEDILYDVVYIYTTNHYNDGYWKTTLSIPADNNLTFVTNATVVSGWEDFKLDYKTPNKSLLVWYLDSVSPYTFEDIADIIKGEDAPLINSIENYEVKDETVKPNPYIGLIALVCIGIAACIGIVIFIGYKLKGTTSDKKEHLKRIANKKFNKRKKKENEELGSVLKKYDDEYSDEEYTEYIKQLDSGKNVSMDEDGNIIDLDEVERDRQKKAEEDRQKALEEERLQKEEEERIKKEEEERIRKNVQQNMFKMFNSADAEPGSIPVIPVMVPYSYPANGMPIANPNTSGDDNTVNKAETPAETNNTVEAETKVAEPKWKNLKDIPMDEDSFF